MIDGFDLDAYDPEGARRLVPSEWQECLDSLRDAVDECPYGEEYYDAYDEALATAGIAEVREAIRLAGEGHKPEETRP